MKMPRTSPRDSWWRSCWDGSFCPRPTGAGAAGDVSEYQIPEEAPSDPAAAFDYAWATGVFHRVLAELETQCRHDGLHAHWGVFQERVAQPLLGRQPAPGLAEICRRYGVASEAQASNMVVTVKRRLRQMLVQHLTRPGAAPAEVEETLQDSLRIFSQPPAS